MKKKIKYTSQGIGVLRLGRFSHSLSLLMALLFISSCSSSENSKYEQIPIDKNKTTFTTKENPKKVIFLIGDGMGLAHISAASLSYSKPLALEQFKKIGLVKTRSLKLITDSAASATAMATGKKTYNGAISVDKNQQKLKTILEYAEESNWLTGIITTATVTHATPACFYGHQPTRSKVNKQLAAEFMTKDIEVLIGGGWNYFKEGLDGRDLLVEAQEKGYFVTNNIEQVGEYCPQKMLCLISPELPPRLAERGNFLPLATQKAIEILNYNRSNFFLVIEGAQIDWGGHENKSDYIIEETIDFDKAVALALEFAKKDKNTLVIVTADHETGGYSVNGEKDGNLDCKFTTDYHTGVMVPIFAYGPGAESFTGIMDNTEIFYKLKHLMDLE